MARYRSADPPSGPPCRGGGVALACAFGVMALTVAALLANHALAERLRRADAAARAEAWIARLADHTPQLPEVLRGAPPSEETRAALAALEVGGGVLQFRLVGVDGRVHAGSAEPPAGGASPAAAPLEQARIPIADAQGPAGMLEARLEEGPRQRLYRASFLLAEVAIAGLGSVTALLLGLLALRRRREAEALAHASFLARHDALTGLATHAELRDRLACALAQAPLQGGRIGLVVLDLRRFREVNDLQGRAAGDDALRLVAGRLRATVRREDTVARLSADRFAVVQAGLRGTEGALRLAERLAEAVAAPLALSGGTTVTLAVDIGLVASGTEGGNAETLLAQAEAALAEARALPGPTIRCFEPALDEALRRRRETERDLRLAITAGQFALHYQPQRRLRDGRLVGFEALLRWYHPDRGLVPPAEFIPLAEQSGLIVPLGAWVIGAACAEAARWRDGVHVAVNLSPAQFRHGDLVATVARALETSGLPANRLELEITESLLQEDTDAVVTLLRDLRALGVAIAMDDFGTGWSSLAHLWRFPYSKLKIDRAFVRDLGRDPRLIAIIATVVGLGRTLGMTVVAEGVETEDQARLLAAQDCEQGQGWLFGRPMPADAARALIEAEDARWAVPDVA